MGWERVRSNIKGWQAVNRWKNAALRDPPGRGGGSPEPVTLELADEFVHGGCLETQGKVSRGPSLVACFHGPGLVMRTVPGLLVGLATGWQGPHQTRRRLHARQQRAGDPFPRAHRQRFGPHKRELSFPLPTRSRPCEHWPLLLSTPLVGSWAEQESGNGHLERNVATRLRALPFLLQGSKHSASPTWPWQATGAPSGWDHILGQRRGRALCDRVQSAAGRLR